MKTVVFTGSCCSGKSTLLREFDSTYPVLEEIARDVLASPVGGPIEISGRIYDLQREQELSKGLDSEYRFLDRSAIDAYWYPQHKHGLVLERDIHRHLDEVRYDVVFFLEMAPEHLYRQDDVRKETYPEAKEIERQLFAAYRSFGFDPFVLPFTTVENRLQVVKSILHGRENVEEVYYGN